VEKHENTVEKHV